MLWEDFAETGEMINSLSKLNTDWQFKQPVFLVTQYIGNFMPNWWGYT